MSKAPPPSCESARDTKEGLLHRVLGGSSCRGSKTATCAPRFFVLGGGSVCFAFLIVAMLTVGNLKYERCLTQETWTCLPVQGGARLHRRFKAGQYGRQK